jgi:cell division protein FtsI (penicillin-binding protein 3)
MSLKKDILWRVALVYLMMLIFGLAIIGRIFYLQWFEKDKWQQKANVVDMHSIEANRGNIYATDGRLLASSVPYFEIRMDTRSQALTSKVFNQGIDSLAWHLSNLFKDRSKEAYKQNIIRARNRGKRYHLIKRNVTFTELQKVRKFPIFRLGRYKGGFIYNQINKRFQPHVDLAVRTIGYTTRSERGNVVGLEGAYDYHLRGEEGRRLMQKIAGGLWMPVNDANDIDPKDGRDIITTIDINLQDVAHSALLRQLVKHEAHHGTAVLMEVQTGDVKAIVNLQRNENGAYREIYNYAIGESSEPGSTFKLPALLAAIEDGFVDLNDSIDTGNGKVKFYDQVIRDIKPGGYGKLTVQEVFEHSSNVGMSKIITECYKNKEHAFIDRLYSMRLNQKLGVEIKGEGAPDIKYPGDKLWSGVSLAMMSHGYELRLTPLQILTFYNAIANDGKMMKPRFVKELRYHDKVEKEIETEVLHPAILSASTIRKAKKILEGVVERGTAENLKNSNFKIAGKTGTAQIANEKYGYEIDSKVSYLASFVGYFPAGNPKYSCIVVVNSPSRDVYYGNVVAGPVFQEIANKVYATSFDMHNAIVEVTTNVDEPPYSKCGYKSELDYVFSKLGCAVVDEHVNSPWVLTKKVEDKIVYRNENINKNLVPNVKEMGAKDAMYLLESTGLKVKIKGRGKVVSQSLLPGTPIKKGDKITLEMSFI